jgi:hypothetical protein
MRYNLRCVSIFETNKKLEKFGSSILSEGSISGRSGERARVSPEAAEGQGCGCERHRSLGDIQK